MHLTLYYMLYLFYTKMFPPTISMVQDPILVSMVTVDHYLANCVIK